MHSVLLHLRPSVGRTIVGSTAVCGAVPESPDYAEITTAEYVTLFMPRQHPRGRICIRCADRFRLDLKAHMRKRE